MELGHPQPPTPIHVDKKTAMGIVNNTIKRQQSRAMKMKYFRLLCQEAQKILDVSHHPGLKNMGDYHSEAHFGQLHRHIRPYYIHMPTSTHVLYRASMPST